MKFIFFFSTRNFKSLNSPVSNSLPEARRHHRKTKRGTIWSESSRHAFNKFLNWWLPYGTKVLSKKPNKKNQTNNNKIIIKLNTRMHVRCSEKSHRTHSHLHVRWEGHMCHRHGDHHSGGQMAHRQTHLSTANSTHRADRGILRACNGHLRHACRYWVSLIAR